MTEITNFPTDNEIGFATQEIGDDPITGLTTFRRFWKLEADLMQREAKVWYHEWKTGKDGKMYAELFSSKYYFVVDIQPDGQNPGSPRYTNWFNQLQPTLAPAINDVLKNQLPINCDTAIVP